MATRTISDAGGNWNATGTWVEGVVPTNADDVVATATSGAVSINTTTCVCKSIDLTGYTNTLTFTAGQKLTVSGNVNFTTGVGGAIAGTGTLDVNATATLTSAGKTFPGALTFSVSSTKTLADDWTVTRLFTSATSTQTVNGNTLYLNGGITTTGNLNGSTNITLGGGTWTGSNGTIEGTGNLNLAGNITFSASTCRFYGKTMNYISGTITTTNNILALNSSCTLNIDGITLNQVKLGGSASTITLASDFHAKTILFDAGGSNATTFSGDYDIYTETARIIRSASTAINITLVSGRTFYISSTLSLVGLALTGNLTLKSSTSSSSAYINYSGTTDNCNVSGITFTDIDASGSAQRIDNWYGGTLTRTSNIYNRTSTDIKSDIFGIM